METYSYAGCLITNLGQTLQQDNRQMDTHANISWVAYGPGCSTESTISLHVDQPAITLAGFLTISSLPIGLPR